MGPLAHPAVTDTPLIARDAEVARWRAMVREASRGHGCALFITGETGIGKKRLVEALAQEAARHGARTGARLLGCPQHLTGGPIGCRSLTPELRALG